MLDFFLKSFLCMAVSCAIYRLFLQNKKSFFFNRGFLIFSLVGSVIAPFITSTLISYSTPITESLNYILSPGTIGIYDSLRSVPDIGIEAQEKPSIMYLIYLGVCILILIKTGFSLFKLLWLSFTKHLTDIKGIHIIEVEGSNAPYSFFYNLYVTKAMYEEGISSAILEHESCHANHYHSVDRLLCEFILMIHWWNPFAYILRNYLQDNHEYTADAYSVKNIGNKNSYIKELLGHISSQNSNGFLYTGFYHSSLLNRISMINLKCKKLNPLSALVIILIYTGLLLSCTDKLKYSDFEISIEKDDGEIIMTCESGCAWIDLSYKNDEPKQAINEYGMTDMANNELKAESDLANFFFTVTRTKDGITLEGIEGTAWIDLSFTLSEGENQKINQFGMTE
ncbi:MAG: hypothetical protein ACI9FN_003845 [Saprospiraceae bacterium]|jgi:hypothetical protein